MESDDNWQQTPFQKTSFNLTSILIDASVSRFDNVNEMSPENQTLVH